MYQHLETFIENIWKSKAKYKVLLSNSIVNLNQAFLETKNVKYDDTYTLDNLITDTALLLSTEEITKYYINNEEFPRILIADCVIIHGEKIVQLLDNFENLIISFLDDKGIKESKLSIHNKLYSAVNIYVFAQSNKELCIDKRFAFKSEMKLPMHEIRQLSQKLATAFKGLCMTNMNSVLTVKKPFRMEEGYYTKVNEEKSILKTIQITNKLVSFVILGDIEQDRLSILSIKIIKKLDKVKNCKALTKILDYSKNELIQSKLQLISLLLSIEYLVDYCRKELKFDDRSIYTILLKSNISKIAINFGKKEDTIYELARLINHLCFIENLKFSDIVSEYTEPIKGLADTEETASVESKELTENIIYEIAINNECTINRYIKEHLKIEDTNSNILNLNQYINIMNKNNTSTTKALENLLDLVNESYVYIDYTLDKDKIHQVIKTEELSTHILPLKVYDFIPALVVIERNSSKETVKVNVNAFINYLKDNIKDDKNIEVLVKNRSSITYIYFSEQSFSEFNSELKEYRDKASTGKYIRYAYCFVEKYM